MTVHRLRMLFLCTGNSARSIMAEAIANDGFGDQLIAASAGSRPKNEPHPLAIETLQRHDIATDWLSSKHVDTFADQPFDLVVTLCDSAANDPCPTFPGAPAHAHWGFPDPPAADDQPAAFEEVFQALHETLELFVRDTEQDLQKRAQEIAQCVAQRFPAQQMTNQ